jgi:deoxyadenosine/deoxycytidine kinase
MEPHYESVDENPYLEDFYGDMKRWSFHLQVYFLNSRFRQILKIKNENKDIIQDRTIYEDRFIFAANLHAMGLMSERDFTNYYSLFDLMELIVTPPDLLIYLKASIPTLVRNIHSRGRDYEKSINIDYLSNLNERYNNWIDSYNKGKLLVINVDDLNFVKNQEDLGVIIEKINAEIHGLF